MSAPYFPMYPADFEADTSHLTLEEDGAYNRLLRLMWMTPGCSLPDDTKWIARRMRVDLDTYERVISPLLEEFFKRSGGRVFSPRLREEFEKVSKTYLKRSEAGKRGGRPKVTESKENDVKAGLSREKAGPKQPEPEPEEKEDNKLSSKKRGSRLPEDWSLPKAWGDWALSEGMLEFNVRREADKFRDYWTSRAGSGGVKLDWLAVWRNWVRKFLDEQPRKQAASGSGKWGKL